MNCIYCNKELVQTKSSPTEFNSYSCSNTTCGHIFIIHVVENEITWFSTTINAENIEYAFYGSKKANLFKISQNLSSSHIIYQSSFIKTTLPELKSLLEYYLNRVTKLKAFS